MIIALPTKESGEKAFVSENLGRANYFYLYDTKTKEGKSFKNNFLNELHGAGVKTAEFLLKYSTDILITPRIGEKALEILLETDINIYKSTEKIARENINDFLNDNLEKLY
ncbi:MAG: NifB/NifX family molybdenum-iron cluster-binding protein [Candidatus Izimaplasma sp.]|nr:NifB/NifX family molybdenum-iron cluster-binding protein [Candidatus Izimaplasma bacterium]